MKQGKLSVATDRSGCSPQQISLFVPDLGGGGAQMVFVRLANRWAQEGLPVEIITAGRGGAHRRHLRAGVRLLELGMGRTRRSLFALARYLRRTQPPVLMSALEEANAVAWLATRLSKGRTALVSSAHQLVSPGLDRPTAGRRATRPLFAAAYRFADGVTAVSCGVAEDVSRATGRPLAEIEVIPNPLDLVRIRGLAGQEDDAGLGPLPRFVTAGRLEPVKDHATLIRAFARIYPSVGGSLTILGEGTLRPELERLTHALGLAHAVKLPGFRANPYPAFKAADVVVMSSLREGFGLVLGEAMALGTQVVTTDAPGGVLEVVGDGKYGFVGRVGDPVSLAEAMARALNTPLPVDVLRARASDFDDHRIANRYRDYLLRIAARRGRDVHYRQRVLTAPTPAPDSPPP